ncbi:VanZ family protein [Anabaena sp. UHCC 0399]|uniref:VanZ family protein n=1 Tax=Anabaena sp. UHCC 0399 TaxID=3110238 RepID=UPI002B214BF2|nr:VanZ family protein [Anabaena sp. UHCC 0399]MEA5564484.1 VanZ family protein [Anabaena sp. UHCC 0399]
MNNQQKYLQPYNWLLCSISILAVFLATLYPFNFSDVDNFSLPEVILSFNNSSSFQDQVNNILLFMPLGFSLARFLQSLKIKSRLQILLVILASLSLSLTVEVLQIFLPSRMPTPADLLNNTLGGFLGYIGFYIWNKKSFNMTVERIETSRFSQSNQQILGFFIGYLFVTLLISLLWQSTTNLSNWDVNYPLIIGNERTGDKPWQGYISEIHIADKALSRNQIGQVLRNSSYFDNLGDYLLVHYQFNEKCCYQDKTLQLPKLIWQGEPINQDGSQGVFLSNNHWLQTSAPVTKLSEKISQTSEVTISAIVKAANTEQDGPARIISISDNSFRRNLTVGQEGNSLDFRIRTPITGENGSELKLNIPNIFVDTRPHHLVITYARGTIQVYVDNLQNAYSFNLLELIPKQQRVFYYALTFIPLGIGLTILTLLTKRRFIFSKVIYSGILIPSLILEGVLVSESGKNFSIKNLLMGITFTAGTMLLLKARASQIKLKN